VTVFYADESVTLYHGDALNVLRELPPAAVNCVVTSPPYFAVRAYSHDPREIGREQTPAEYVDHLRAVMAEVWRVLADDGVLWLNLGDTWYSGRGNPGPNGVDAKNRNRRGWQRPVDTPGQAWGRQKCLLGIPWRVAFALMDDGWTLRQEVIWAKRNCTPDPAADRPGRAHEQVFMFVKGPHYYFDALAIREESDPDQQAKNERYAKVYDAHTRRADSRQPGNQNSKGIHSRPGDPGRHPRSVWTISAQPFSGDHPATMPPGLAEKCILSSCPPGGVVLDPFSGSGTTGMVAARLGRRYVGIDLNADYLGLSLRTRLAQTALTDTTEEAG
jgi:DNA modification methylase